MYIMWFMSMFLPFQIPNHANMWWDRSFLIGHLPNHSENECPQKPCLTVPKHHSLVPAVSRFTLQFTPATVILTASLFSLRSGMPQHKKFMIVWHEDWYECLRFWVHDTTAQQAQPRHDELKSYHKMRHWVFVFNLNKATFVNVTTGPLSGSSDNDGFCVDFRIVRMAPIWLGHMPAVIQIFANNVKQFTSLRQTFTKILRVS